MKIAILLGRFSVGARPLDFWYDNIYSSSRGLTGTDLATVMLSSELQKLGHDVSLFTCHAEPHNKPNIWENIKLYNYDEKNTIIDDSFDALISINEPDSLRDLTSKPLRICWQFLNDFSFCQAGFDDLVDLWLSPSQMLLEHLVKQATNKNKWKVLELGCDPDLYQDNRIPGRVIWTSSADRGVHWLLQEWPKIKKAVPYATLKIFYHFGYGNLLTVEPDSKIGYPHTIEMAQRLRYIQESVKKLKPLGVEHVGSVSRRQLAQEVSAASVFAYCTDTVAFSEGFSVSTLENLAGFTVPIVTDVDCLGSVYNNSGAIVIKSPVRDHLPEFTDAVITGLTDKEFADSVIEKCRIFAKTHSWSNIANKMQSFILEHSKIKSK